MQSCTPDGSENVDYIDGGEVCHDWQGFKEPQNIFIAEICISCQASYLLLSGWPYLQLGQSIQQPVPVLWKIFPIPTVHPKLPLDNTNRSNPSFLFAWSLWGVDGLMRLTHLVTMIITVLLFLLVEGKSFNKPNLFLLPLVFGLFHTWNSVPCWGGTNSWEVLDFTPKSDSAFPVPDQTAAAFCASSVSSPQPTSHPQRPATQNNGSSW